MLSQSPYSIRAKPSRIASLIANVDCCSDSESSLSDGDVQEPEYFLHINDFTNEHAARNEPEPFFLEINDSAGDAHSKSQTSRGEKDRVWWTKVTGRQASLRVAPFVPNEDECLELLPMQYFKRFISDEILERICEQSNLYASQKNPSKPLQLNKNELEQWIGISLQMSLTKISNTRLHWSQHCLHEKISSTMTRQRWENIKVHLHFVDNATIDHSDKLAKVRLLVDHLRREFRKIPMTEFLSIDEEMVPFNAASLSMKQHIPKKPHKWGYKIFVLADHTGMVYDFFPYTGKIPAVSNPRVPDLGPNSNSVLHLAECIPDGKNFKLHCDNWFCSMELIDHLATRRIWVCGTVQEGRLHGLSLKSEKQFSASGRCSFEEYQTQTENTTITAVKWFDNRSVCLASSFVTSLPVQKCESYDNAPKEYDEVPIPNIVRSYNQHMGGIDVHDQLMTSYRMGFHSKKYYLYLIFHLIDMCVINSWLLYRRAQDKLNVKRSHQNSLCEFKMRLATSLMMNNKNSLKKRGRPSSSTVEQEHARKKFCGHATKALPEHDVRRDGIGHFPEITEKRGTCKYPGCKGKILMFCTKCRVHLCCERKRNCFLKFHC